jgi:hypothetical protein
VPVPVPVPVVPVFVLVVVPVPVPVVPVFVVLVPVVVVVFVLVVLLVVLVLSAPPHAVQKAATVTSVSIASVRLIPIFLPFTRFIKLEPEDNSQAILFLIIRPRRSIASRHPAVFGVTREDRTQFWQEDIAERWIIQGTAENNRSIRECQYTCVQMNQLHRTLIESPQA